MTTVATDADAGEQAEPANPSRWYRLLTGVPGRALLAVMSGGVLFLSFPPRPLWFLAPVAFAGLGVLVYRRRARAAFGYGLLFTLTFFLLHLLWILDFLGRDFGPAPWLALSGLQAVFAALACAAMAVVQRLPAAPVWMAALWVGQETLRGAVPLNGFPWGRTAFGQPSGAFTSLASIGGAPLVTFAVALCGFGLAWLVLVVAKQGVRRPQRAVRFAAAAAYTVVPVVAGLAVWPTISTAAETGEVTVAVVQGNAPNIGFDLLGERDVVRTNHLKTSERLLSDIEAGRVEQPDLVVWPETSYTVAGDDAEMDSLVARFGVPSLIGALYRPPTGPSENSVFAWDPEKGRGEHYAKQELVPFAEYVPWRAIAAQFTPFLDNTPDMAWGDQPGVLYPYGPDEFGVGLQICYEVAYDYVGRATVAEGAELFVIPTNNAWFGAGEMSYQQLAMSRLRAVEHGRAAAVAATSGVSAMVLPDGTVLESTQLYTSDIVVATLPLRSTTTVATVIGAWPERVLVTMGLLALAASVGWRLRDRARRRAAV